MYVMYVDESGDPGVGKSPTRFFVLSAIVVHEDQWRTFVESLVQFKKIARVVHGLPMRAEIHASELICRNPHKLAKPARLAIIRNFIDELAKMQFISITNVIVDKHGKPHDYDVFTNAWRALFQRFENTLKNGNFPGKKGGDSGIVITDATSGTKLLRLVRKMAVYNPIPHDGSYGPGARNVPITRILEDPHGRNSRDSLPIQACDVVAYSLLQKYAPNSYMKKRHASKYFDRLSPVLNKKASRGNELGVVLL